MSCASRTISRSQWAAALKMFMGVMSIWLGELSSGNRRCISLCRSSCPSPSSCRNRPGAAIKRTRVRLRLVMLTLPNVLREFAVQAGRRSRLRLKRRREDVGDLVVGERLDGVVEDAADAIGRLQQHRRSRRTRRSSSPDSGR